MLGVGGGKEAEDMFWYWQHHSQSTPDDVMSKNCQHLHQHYIYTSLTRMLYTESTFQTIMMMTINLQSTNVSSYELKDLPVS